MCLCPFIQFTIILCSKNNILQQTCMLSEPQHVCHFTRLKVRMRLLELQHLTVHQSYINLVIYIKVIL